MATTLLQGAEILNESLRKSGYDFQIDLTDNDTITAGIEKIGTYSPEQLNVIMQQMNLVIQTRNYGAMFTSEKNKFRDFLVDLYETGFGIEDIFHELIEGVTPDWDKNATGEEKAEKIFSYDTNKQHKTFHVEKKDNQVKTTVDQRNYNKVFTPRGVTSFIDVKLANLSYSMEVWLLDRILEIVKKMITDERCIVNTGNNINTSLGVRNMTEKIKTYADGYLLPSSNYNYGVYDETLSDFRSVTTITPSADDVYIITTPQNMNRLKVQGYANAYNLSEFELKNRIIYAPNGTNFGSNSDFEEDEEVLFIVLDRRTIVAGISFWRASSMFIPTSFETNHFLTAEILVGYNTFFNCTVFSGEPFSNFIEEMGGV